MLSERSLLIKMEKQEVLEERCPRENTLQFLGNKANTLYVRFAHSTWAGITLPCFYFFFKFSYCFQCP